MLDLSILIVNWNGGSTVKNCLASLLGAPSALQKEIIVVDNASTDGSNDMIRREFPQVHFIQNGENRGYGTGNNQAFRVSRGRYFLVLNNDVAVIGASLDGMVRYMDAHSEVGLLGPALQSPVGLFQSSANRRFPNLLDVFLEELFYLTSLRYIFLRSRIGAGVSKFFWGGKIREVSWVGGASLLIRREAVDPIGPFDEHFFFYREDCDLCLRLRKKGWKIVYHPDFIFTHFWGDATQKNLRKISIEGRRSLLYYFRKHQGRSAFGLAKLFLLAGLSIRTAFLFLNTLFWKKEEKRLRFFREMVCLFYKMEDPSQAVHVD